jgi:uncharacterized protein
MTVATAHVPTTFGAKYLQQLCKHWGHKLEVEFTDGEGTVRFPDAVATLKAGPEALTVAVEAADPTTVERMKQVVATHLDRFAFREAPLAFDWG